MFGTRTEETKSTKRETITVWSGSFMSTFEAEGYANHGAKTYSLTTYNGDAVPARLPEGVTAPRTNENFHQIDAAISDALSRHYAQIGAVTL